MSSCQVDLEVVHFASLKTSSALSKFAIPGFISPLKLIKVLTAARVQFMLIGAHGIGGWMRKPRACSAVDFLVSARGFAKARDALMTAFPRLQPSDDPHRLYYSAPYSPTIGLCRADNAFMQAILKHAFQVRARRCQYRIPALEAAITLCFEAIRSPATKYADRYQHAHDFGSMIQANPTIDESTLKTLGDLTAWCSGNQLVKKVRAIRAGDKLNLF